MQRRSWPPGHGSMPPPLAKEDERIHREAHPQAGPETDTAPLAADPVDSVSPQVVPGRPPHALGNPTSGITTDGTGKQDANFPDFRLCPTPGEPFRLEWLSSCFPVLEPVVTSAARFSFETESYEFDAKRDVPAGKHRTVGIPADDAGHPGRSYWLLGSRHVEVFSTNVCRHRRWRGSPPYQEYYRSRPCRALPEFSRAIAACDRASGGRCVPN
jgi:hypothetical protein